MTAIGLDVGTGFVKCVSDAKRIRFPSLYAYRLPHAWEKEQRKVEGVGDAAAAMLHDPDTISISPVMYGRPVNEEAFSKLVREAVTLTTDSRDALGENPPQMAFAVGLPYEAKSSLGAIQKMITRLYKPIACDVVPQALGTIVCQSMTDGIVVSIGRGTTEIVAFLGNEAKWGQSHHHAVGYISSKIGGEYSYLDDTIFASGESAKLVSALADYIINRIQASRQIFPSLQVIVSGNGILIPGMEQVIRSRIDDIIIPQDPVMSNAIGLYKIASWYKDSRC
ncbi:MAG: hypothetical protein KGI33_10485 [Thaumarchaeota archaeon]|nr:hypothetical protein [Nitrososphaerota archaeon]